MKRLLAIDTDPGIDDALALMLAFACPDAQVSLVTTVAGNVPVSVATANARRILGLMNAGPDTRLAQGSARPLAQQLTTAMHVHGTDGLAGLSTASDRQGRPFFPSRGPSARRGAVDLLIDAAERHGPDLTLIALGPLTNVAHAIARAPETMSQIGRLVAMGGAIDVPGNITAVAEFNLYVDPLAAEEVFASGLPITLVPLDVTQRVRLKPHPRAKARDQDSNPFAELAHRLVHEGFEGNWRDAGMPMHDPLAVAVALQPDLVRTTSAQVRVEHQGHLTRGQCVVDRRAHRNTSDDSRSQLDIALEVDVDRAIEFIGAHLLRASGARLSSRTKAKRPARRRRVAVLGGANIDQVVVTPRLPAPGETVAGADLAVGLGGKGANQALATRRAGSPVDFFTLIGNDSNGDLFRRALSKQDITLHEPRYRGNAPTGTALICVDSAGENLIAVAPGANNHFRWRQVDQANSILAGCSVLVAQFELPMQAVVEAFRCAKKEGLLTILNAAPAADAPRHLPALVDILIVNETEAALLAPAPTGSGRSATRNRSPASSLRALRASGFATAILTLGAKGAMWIDGNGIHRQAAFVTDTVDTTGAGDTFVGYLASDLARGLHLDQAVRSACAAGALAVTQPGAQGAIPRRAQVRRLSG